MMLNKASAYVYILGNDIYTRKSGTRKIVPWKIAPRKITPNSNPNPNPNLNPGGNLLGGDLPGRQFYGGRQFSGHRKNSSTNIFLFIVNNRNTRKRCEICSKLTIKSPQRRSTVFINTFEHVSYLFTTFSSVSTVGFEQVDVCWVSINL